jgi:DNA-binding GntR family transcriptional regulator
MALTPLAQKNLSRREKNLPLREKAYAAFTDRLLSREIKPGQFITQRELVALSGLPLGAIRELIPRLEAEGLIVTVPQRGLQVAHIDLDLIRNAFQFRLFMEREAARLFTQQADQKLIDDLQRDHAAIMERALKGQSEHLVRDAQEVDRLLHETIIDHLGNDIISKAYRVNWIKVKIIRQNETRLFDDLVIPAMQDHLAILAAMQNRDSEAAAEAMSTHIHNARQRALSL